MSSNESEFMTQEEQGFDIFAQAEAAKKEDEGTDVHIRGIDDKPLYFTRDGQRVPVIIRVAGTNSQRYRDAEKQSRKRKLKASALTGQAVFDETIDKTSHCTLAWDGFTDRGTPIDCTPHNAAMLYKRCPWVLNQVVEAMQDHERFFSNDSVEP